MDKQQQNQEIITIARFPRDETGSPDLIQEIAGSLTAKAALEQAIRWLQPGPGARADAEILLGHVLEKPRHWPYVWPETPLTTLACRRFQALIERRAAGVPIAYLIGRCEFWSLELSVSPPVLIPRPDTECLVEVALECIPQRAKWRIADLGTGAAPIALALARERADCRIIATDISTTALAIARQNLNDHGITNVILRQGDWFDALDRNDYHLIVSNPPYVATDDPHLLGDIRFEPSLALTSGPEGLDAISHLARHAPAYLKPSGWLILEHGFEQGKTVRSLLRALRYQRITTRRDYGGQERITLGQRG
uniref:Release factor glutamine methyltransferase n=1 Tax=Candidatus Kentrum sp. MB TaxID=2138164 RepID=A0A450XM15_9GAMM|nr:MAG: [protein release factor]-glutamine N5-methyltransferase [Candidatus Kentron sp. MB]VFK30314.1 MAG: [protein release factor]-glutamine N5-methyltransferase [Candidatus Kentron sp. MB]VFK74275.1 MAG: [protein release factor]-glutamine N5-methyltransferase [Candidatus Kentron sp. MB]